MNDNPERAVGELASDLDDLTTRVEELEVDAASKEHTNELGRLRLALENAGNAADAVVEDIDDQESDSRGKH